MSPLVTSTGPEDLAHLVHYGIVAAGLAGVAPLVLPASLARAGLSTGPGNAVVATVPLMIDRTGPQGGGPTT